MHICFVKFINLQYFPLAPFTFRIVPLGKVIDHLLAIILPLPCKLLEHIVCSNINDQWRPKMSHADFGEGFWKTKIWIRRSSLLPILYQKDF